MSKVTSTLTIRVGAREANQQFSKLLREVEAGAEVVVTRSGVEVARIEPTQTALSQAERERKANDLRAWMEAHAFNSGGYTFNREDAYK